MKLKQTNDIGVNSLLKIKDRIVHGMISGILAGIPDTILNGLAHRAGLSELSYTKMEANIFLPQNRVNSKGAGLLGLMANYTLLGISGVGFSYLLAITGRDRALIKGIGYGLTSWLLFYGVAAKLGLPVTRKVKKPLTPLLSFVDHAIYGGLLGLIAPALGDDSLFPNDQI